MAPPTRRSLCRATCAPTRAVCCCWEWKCCDARFEGLKQADPRAAAAQAEAAVAAAREAKTVYAMAVERGVTPMVIERERAGRQPHGMKWPP